MPRFMFIWLPALLLGIHSCVSYGPVKPELPIEEEHLSSCQPTGPLLQLFSLLGLEHENTMGSIIQVTQEKWLRKPGTERWQIPPVYEQHRNLIMPILKQMNMVDPILPSSLQYDYAVILGARLPTVRERIEFLIQQWEQGVRFNQIVFLTGQRFLDELEIAAIQPKPGPRIKKNWLPDKKNPTTETDMMKTIFSQFQLPTGMERLELAVADAPEKTLPDGKKVRPNTGDTVIAWLKLDPKPGSVLAVSSQPLVSYQDAVLKTLLPQTFSIDTVGKEAPENLSIGVYLDNLARLLYQKCNRQ